MVALIAILIVIVFLSAWMCAEELMLIRKEIQMGLSDINETLKSKGESDEYKEEKHSV